jgi:hypothetical protein
MAKKAKRTPVLIGALTKNGAFKLMKTYRDKIGATLHDKEPSYEEKTGHWLFKVSLPWDD